MPLSAIIAGRRDALIRAWTHNPLIQVQVESPLVLRDLVFIDDPDQDATVGPLGRRRQGNVAVVRGIGAPDANSSVWVSARYGSYKAAYTAFIEQVYGVKPSVADLVGFDVDHLLNRARSPKNSTFIRIEAVPSDANQRWGSLFERAASDPRFSANQERERRTMSWMICAKLAGEMPPEGPDDTAGIERLVRFFASIGLATDEAREGLTSMIAFAYRFR